MQASLSQPNHQDSTKHLKGVCVCVCTGIKGDTGKHVQSSNWVSCSCSSFARFIPPRSISRALGHFGTRGARDQQPRARLPPGLLITRHLRG